MLLIFASLLVACFIIYTSYVKTKDNINNAIPPTAPYSVPLLGHTVIFAAGNEKLAITLKSVYSTKTSILR
jgi:archaellum component FlaF (FlaF/FlaG flagellin family)